jgi:aminoglycoside phosphotransferase (APT) family kinase protein
VDDEVRRRIEARLGLEVRTVVEIDEGWDSSVFEIDGEWIVRVPRRAEVREAVRVEARLLRELGPALPIAVPRFEAMEDAHDLFFVAYRKLPGEPLGGPPASLAPQLASFIAALHDFPRTRAARAGVEPQADVIERCRQEALPLLTPDERRRADRMFDRFLSGEHPEPALVHGDLGPAHILRRASNVTGVIDWSDASLGDPALDFAWLLHGTSKAFASGLFTAYGCQRDLGPGLRERALFYHRLGPWHEVLFGLKHGRRDLVSRGLAGIRARLP